MILPGALVGTGADTNPGCQLWRGRECGGLRSDLSQDLLSCLGANTGNFDQPQDRILMLLHLRRRQLVQLVDLPVDQIDAVQVLGKQPAVDIAHRAGQGVARAHTSGAGRPAPPKSPDWSHRRPERAGFAGR